MKGSFYSKLKMEHSLFIIILILLVLHLNWDAIRVNLIVMFTLKRGIISQNCFWWKLNDLLPDATGAEVYQRFKLQGRFVNLNIIGQNIILLTDIQDIKQLLDLSPNPLRKIFLVHSFQKMLELV